MTDSKKKVPARPEEVLNALRQAVPGQQEAFMALGRIDALDRIRRVTHLAIVQQHKELKQSGRYAGIPYMDEDGNARSTTTVKEFYAVFLKCSYRAAQEHEQFFDSLGEDAFVAAEELGLSRVDRRLILSLPDDEKELVQRALEQETKEQVVEILETLAIKHKGEVKAAKKKIDELERAHDTAEHEIKRLSDKTIALDRRLAEATSPTRRWENRALEFNQAITKSMHRVLEGIAHLETIRIESIEADFGANQTDAMEAIGGCYFDAMQRCYAKFVDLIESGQEAFGHYRHKARPLIDMADIFGPIEVPEDDQG